MKRIHLSGLKPAFSDLEYRLLKVISPFAKDRMNGAAYKSKSKLRVLLGDQIAADVKEKVVIDFGCGNGNESVEVAQAGARKVIGIDIRPEMLDFARRCAESAGVSSVCEFRTDSQVQADVIVSLDSFEHFADPATILNKMFDLLRPGGLLAISFGPTWYHPLGGHFFSFPFPWSHLVLSERALTRWRNDLKLDGVTRFCDVPGGLNQMTIRRFESLVLGSKFNVECLEPVPIRKLKFLHNRLTREFTSAIVRCRLRKPAEIRASLIEASAATCGIGESA